MGNLLEETEGLFLAIGETVVRFQQIEQWLAEELAILLKMRDRDDQYLVSAAMSYKQKVDLLVDLFPKRAERHPKMPLVDILEVRKALYTAEEYRNRVVHSFYAVECGDVNRWKRIKGSLRGRAGFSMNSVDTNIQIFKECNEALKIIREWSFVETEALKTARLTLKNHIESGAL